MIIKSVSDVLQYLYKLSLNQSDFRFRGQANKLWEIKPSIYRYNNFYRYQTTFYEKELLLEKPKSTQPPLTYTDFDLEWLMLCQHYGIPTRLVDWSTDVLSALFFACHAPKESSKDGALFICRQSEYPLYYNYEESLSNSQELAFINTYVMNPRMRNQSGCFMMWGHSPKDNSVEIYTLTEYHKHKKSNFFFEKLIILSKYKEKILKELSKYYSINFDTIYLKDGYMQKRYGNLFSNIKEQARLITLHLTDAGKLSNEENNFVINIRGGINCTNMYKNCVNIRKV